MHSQGNLVTAEGARNTKNGHTYNSYGSPMSESSVIETFRDDKGLPPVSERNDKDLVSNPVPNILLLNNWKYHGTEYYGAAKLEREKND